MDQFIDTYTYRDMRLHNQHQMELDKIDNYEKTLVSLVRLIDERDSILEVIPSVSQTIQR